MTTPERKQRPVPVDRLTFDQIAMLCSGDGWPHWNDGEQPRRDRAQAIANNRDLLRSMVAAPAATDRG